MRGPIGLLKAAYRSYGGDRRTHVGPLERQEGEVICVLQVDPRRGASGCQCNPQVSQTVKYRFDSLRSIPEHSLPTSQQTKQILIAPSPRTVSDIFSLDDLNRLRAIGKVHIHENAPFTDELFNESGANADIIIGQIDLPESRLQRARALKAVINVEGNFLPNIDYAYCFRNGIRVLTISPVFAEPVAEAALGMAIDLARGDHAV
jgi:hypothetical protein